MARTRSTYNQPSKHLKKPKEIHSVMSNSKWSLWEVTKPLASMSSPKRGEVTTAFLEFCSAYLNWNKNIYLSPIIYLSIHSSNPSINHPSIYLIIYLSIHPSNHLSIYLSIYHHHHHLSNLLSLLLYFLPICLPAYLPKYLLIYPSVSFLSGCMFIYLTIYL